MTETTTTKAQATYTYLVRNAQGDIVGSRTSATMAYTHAVLVTNKTGAKVMSWHLTQAAATREQRSRWAKTGKVVAVEAHQGAKATVLARLAKAAQADAADKADVAKATKAATKAPAKATKAPAKAATKEAPATKLHQSKGVAQGAVLEVGGVAHPGLDWQARMDAKGWNHMVTAEAMGVAPMTLGRVARAQASPSVALTVKFAKAMGVAPTTLWKAVADFDLAVALEASK